MPPYIVATIAQGARYGTFKDIEQTRRVSRAHVYKLLADGKIVARKLGSRTLIDLASLDAYLSSLPEARVAPSRPPGQKVVRS
jgi:excisionase family DNA binding protein